MIFVIFLLIFLFILASISKSSEGKAPETIEFTRKEHIPVKTLLDMRYENAKLINECIHQMNSSSKRKSITSWRFMKGSAEDIYIRFSDSKFDTPAHLSFIKSKASPHVSRITYVDEFGKSRVLRGYIPKGFTYDMLLEKFKKDRKDKARIKYINDAARVACEKGEATFNILAYLDISETEFKESFRKREEAALSELLREDFKTVEKEDLPWLLKVTPKDEPI